MRCIVRSWFLLVLGLGPGLGCLDDDRCGPNLRRVGERCVAKVDAAVASDRGVADGQTSDRSRADWAGERTASDGGASCKTLTASELAGGYTLKGTVDASTCSSPMPLKGDLFNADLTMALDDSAKLQGTITVFGLPVTGDVSIEADGRVILSAKGEMMGISFAFDAKSCFSDSQNATVTTQAKLSNGAGPLCAFDVAGTLKRK